MQEQAPIKIEHLVDTDLSEKTGKASYFYNYLLYTFEHPKGQVTARAYLDEIQQVSLISYPDGADLEGIIAFLRLRYRRVKRLTSTGYVRM